MFHYHEADPFHYSVLIKFFIKIKTLRTDTWGKFYGHKIHFIITRLLLFSLMVEAKEQTSVKKVLILASDLIDMGNEDKHAASNKLWEVAPHTMCLLYGFEVDFVAPKDRAVARGMALVHLPISS